MAPDSEDAERDQWNLYFVLQLFIAHFRFQLSGCNYVMVVLVLIGNSLCYFSDFCIFLLLDVNEKTLLG